MVRHFVRQKLQLKAASPKCKQKATKAGSFQSQAKMPSPKELSGNGICNAMCCHSLGGRFGYFLFFLCSGRVKGGFEAQGGEGIGFLLKIPGGGWFQEGREGVGRVSAANWGFGGGGGLNIFFRRRNVHQVVHHPHPHQNGGSLFTYSWSFFTYS